MLGVDCRFSVYLSQTGKVRAGGRVGWGCQPENKEIKPDFEVQPEKKGVWLVVSTFSILIPYLGKMNPF